jgi:hypothetical protein
VVRANDKAMNETPWYQRLVRIRERWVVALLLVAAFVVGLVGDGGTAVALKVALVLAAAVIVVVALRRPQS